MSPKLENDPNAKDKPKIRTIESSEFISQNENLFTKVNLKSEAAHGGPSLHSSSAKSLKSAKEDQAASRNIAHTQNKEKPSNFSQQNPLTLDSIKVEEPPVIQTQRASLQAARGQNRGPTLSKNLRKKK